MYPPWRGLISWPKNERGGVHFFWGGGLPCVCPLAACRHTVHLFPKAKGTRPHGGGGGSMPSSEPEPVSQPQASLLPLNLHGMTQNRMECPHVILRAGMTMRLSSVATTFFCDFFYDGFARSWATLSPNHIPFPLFSFPVVAGGCSVPVCCFVSRVILFPGLFALFLHCYVLYFGSFPPSLSPSYSHTTTKTFGNANAEWRKLCHWIPKTIQRRKEGILIWFLHKHNGKTKNKPSGHSIHSCGFFFKFLFLGFSYGTFSPILLLKTSTLQKIRWKKLFLSRNTNKCVLKHVF